MLYLVIMIKNNNATEGGKMKKEIHTAKGLWIVEKLNNIAFVEFTSKKLTSMTKWVIVDGQIVKKENIIGNANKIHSDVWKEVA